MPSLEKYSRSLPYTYAPGLFPAMEALKKAPATVSRVLIKSTLHEEAAQTLIEAARLAGVRTETADKALSAISGKDNCFAAAVTQKRSPALLQAANHLVLHHPQDKGNLGTMLRSALGFGFLDIAIITPAADVWDPQVIRASMGAIFSLRVQEYADFEQYEQAYPAQHSYPFMLDGSVTLGDALQNIRRPYRLIMGNEGAGLPSSFRQKGTPVRIAHTDAIDSLNLSVAASIGMYSFSAAE